MRALALALQQPEGFFTEKCDDPVAQMVLFRWEAAGRWLPGWLAGCTPV